jgi:hypothetical protein
MHMSMEDQTPLMQGPSKIAPESEARNGDVAPEPAKADQATAVQTEEPQNTGDDAAEPRRRNSIGQRIGELTRQKYELAAKNAEYERRLAEIEARQNPAHNGNTSSSGDDRPTPDKFDTYEQWVEAITDYKAAQKADERINTYFSRQKEEEARARAEETRNEARRTYQNNVAKAEERYADYHEVTADLPVTENMAFFILGHQKGPDIAYYLGNNPAEAERIRNLSPVQQGYEMARLEAKLDTPQAAARSVTSAPEPINPVRAKGSSAPRTDLSKVSMAEYARIRQQQMRDARKR